MPPGQPAHDLPPYAYLPGRDPHPTRHPQGHAYAAAKPEGDARAALRRGLVLFDHGYYWEAHEAWEAPYHEAARDGSARMLFKGLIALAAAGLKVRQGLPDQATRFAGRAARIFTDLAARGGPRYLGLELARLQRFARQAEVEAPGLPGRPELPVWVVFEGRLGEG